jgi:hypothetical protein
MRFLQAAVSIALIARSFLYNKRIVSRRETLLLNYEGKVPWVRVACPENLTAPFDYEDLTWNDGEVPWFPKENITSIEQPSMEWYFDVFR